MARVAAGKFDQQITIEEPVEANHGGDIRESWPPLFTNIWAKVETRGGRETVAAGESRGELSHLVSIRYRTGITSRCRVIWGSKILQLVAPPVNVDQADVLLEMACIEVE